MPGIQGKRGLSGKRADLPDADRNSAMMDHVMGGVTEGKTVLTAVEVEEAQIMEEKPAKQAGIKELREF